MLSCSAAEADKFYDAVELFANACETWSKIVAGYRYRVENFQDEPGIWCV